MDLEILEPDPSTYDELVELRLKRQPRLRRAQAEWPLVHAEELAYLHLRAAYVPKASTGTAELVGWGSALRGRWFPPTISMVGVVVDRDHERRGIGGALYREVLATVPPDAETLGTTVDDADPESLAVARAHGFEVTQHGIESELDLVDLPGPVPPPGVTFEDVSDLVFPDEETVEAMVLDSQTNPEAAEGFVSGLGSFREIAARTETEIAALARVDGAPAAIVIGEVEDGVLGIAYTGVGRSYRGRGLAFSLKQYAHRLAADAGATVCHTMNEESNAGVRRINAALGYRVTGGAHRMRRPRG